MSAGAGIAWTISIEYFGLVCAGVVGVGAGVFCAQALNISAEVRAQINFFFIQIKSMLLESMTTIMLSAYILQVKILSLLAVLIFYACIIALLANVLPG